MSASLTLWVQGCIVPDSRRGKRPLGPRRLPKCSELNSPGPF